MKTSDEEPKSRYVRTRFPVFSQILLTDWERDQEVPTFKIRRVLKWTTWSAVCWLLAGALYLIATSSSSPGWALAMSFGLISIFAFVALVYSAFTIGYFYCLLAERRRWRKAREI
ncbi:MAG: hypothetical protein GY708_23840 [Actinomycetia bacterium]|nr:hypothetical protein [Actinomycetes bacterium]